MSKRVLVVVAVYVMAAAVSGFALQSRSGLAEVKGRGCYTYGDDESPRQAQRAAEAIAHEKAVSSYRVYVDSLTRIRNSELQEDLVQSISAGLLRNVESQMESKDRTVCVNVTGMIDPAQMDQLIEQRIKANEVARAAQTAVLSPQNTIGLKVWTDKSAPYLEGDPITISVQSDRDVFLKLDYFQADGTVVHLVPNVYSGDAFIRAGRVTTFGGSADTQKFVVQEPFGAEAIKAIASTKPFEGALMTSKTTEPGAGYLRGLQNATRGLQIKAGDSTAAQWAEASVAVVTMSKATAAHRSAKRP